MNWTNEPATEGQLSHLRRLGYESGRPLTKGEAAHLIQDFEDHPDTQPGLEHDLSEITKREAYLLLVAVEEAKRILSQAAKDQVHQLQTNLALVIARRHQFWINTCRDPRRMDVRSTPVLELHMKYGCRFATPTGEQVREILDALDAGMPMWERRAPELFFAALELNFPELRSRI
jgi:hypothetical protein